ncbi:hypothetical protein HOL63_02875 [Candidatus Peregrinibacteria bacterium]|jgi:hypothetical protein|nr:hypothetical protein [Candidatus Peregrinibacteria bacterium]MBT5468924.1 hypothetical protein [Candidatus Peregrinibacteria bacterium]MBT7337718.1 hypothetical protein [Candidatus Peregrinibacteria bacterium]
MLRIAFLLIVVVSAFTGCAAPFTFDGVHYIGGNRDMDCGSGVVAVSFTPTTKKE